MLKIRVMPTLLYKNHSLVKGEGFNSWRPIGMAMQSVRVFNMREVDELIFLDIAATPDNRLPDFNLIDDLADYCFMPMTVGGGVRSVDTVRELLRVGADKVALNTVLVEDPGVVQSAAKRFGSQCVVASIDARQHDDGRMEVFTHCGSHATGIDPVDLAKEADQLGAGEILLSSVERDGTMTGYNVELTRRVCEAVTIPVIASGGAGNYQHMADVLRDGQASAVAAAAMFQFTQQTPKEAKRFLKEQGFSVRL